MSGHRYGNVDTGGGDFASGDMDKSTNEAGNDVVRNGNQRDPWGCIAIVMLTLIAIAAIATLIFGPW